MEPFTFINYDRISDTLLWLAPKLSLKFSVVLTKKNNFNEEIHFHSEYKYYSNKFERNSYSISRNYDFYYVINLGDRNLNGAILRMNDVLILNMLIDNNILPWYMGPTRIFNMVENGDKMTITGKYQDVILPISESTYIKFSPVVIYYDDTNSYKEGIRFEINSKEIFFDIPLDIFLKFVYIMKNTDMVNLAANMLNYVKTRPYQVNFGVVGSNQSDINSGLKDVNNYNHGKKKGNFFDK